MKKIGSLFSLLMCCFVFVGCGRIDDLPENPIIFHSGELGDYITIENNDKIYVLYGLIKGKGFFNNLNYAFGECLGFVDEDENYRIYKLKGENSDERLVEYYNSGEMDVPVVLREISHKNKENIPESVEPFDADTIEFNELKKSFTGNIVDGTNREIVEITGNYTLYYNDEFGFATVLGEEWKGYNIRIDRIEDDFEYNGEVVKIKRPMIWIGKFISEPDFYSDDYGFSIINNEDTEKLKSDRVVWTTSLYEETYKGRNNKYSFFEASARNGGHRYLLEKFPNLDCKTWTGGIEYDINGNPHEYLNADCNGYEVINGEAVNTRKSWIEQLFPYGFMFYDID